MLKISKKYSGLFFIPIVLLFGVVFSAIHIKFYLIISLLLIINLFYITLGVRIYFPKSIFYPLIIFLVNASLLAILKKSSGIYYLGILYISFSMIILMYIYGLTFKVISLNRMFILYLICCLILAILEMKAGIILPMSIKAESNEYYNIIGRTPTGFFYNPNDFASAVTLVMIYSFTFFYIKQSKTCWIILTISILLLLFTGSRGAMLGLFFLPLAISFASNRNIGKWIFLYLIFFLSIYIFIQNISLSNFDTSSVVGRTLDKIVRLLRIFKGGGDSSFLARFMIITYTFRNLNNIIIGLGPGGAEVFLEGSNYLGIVNPHNLFLEILINYGFIGLFTTLYIYTKAFKISRRICNNTNNIDIIASSIGVQVSIIIFPVISIISSSLLKDWAFAWFPISLFLVTYGNQYGDKYENINCNCKL